MALNYFPYPHSNHGLLGSYIKYQFVVLSFPVVDNSLYMLLTIVRYIEGSHSSFPASDSSWFYI